MLVLARTLLPSGVLPTVSYTTALNRVSQKCPSVHSFHTLIVCPSCSATYNFCDISRLPTYELGEHRVPVPLCSAVRYPHAPDTSVSAILRASCNTPLFTPKAAPPNIRLSSLIPPTYAVPCRASPAQLFRLKPLRTCKYRPYSSFLAPFVARRTRAELDDALNGWKQRACNHSQGEFYDIFDVYRLPAIYKVRILFGIHSVLTL